MTFQNSIPRAFWGLFSLLFLTGCATRSPRISPADQAVFRAFERAGNRAEAAAGNSLVLFRVEQAAASQPQGGREQRRPGIVSFSGIVLSAEGHLLAPFNIRPDTQDRIEAWIGDQQYLARPLKADEQLGMTILKIEPREPLQPLDLSRAIDLRPGQHGIVVIPSDEDNEFARFTFLVFTQGILEGRYRQFSLNPVPNQARGAPVFTVAGELAGLMSQNNAWSLSDLAIDLEELLAEVTGRAVGRTENAWFGATLAPINRDFARANHLPHSALWLVHVFEDAPAHRAGFRSGDLLVSLNGEPLRLSGNRVYQYFLQALRPRADAPFTATVLRDGETIEGQGTLTVRTEPATLRAEDLGVTLSAIDEALVVRLNLFTSEGVLVTDVHRGSPAATGRQFGRNLIMPRDVITAIGGHPTPTLAAFSEALDHIRRDRPASVLVEFHRGPITGFEALNLRIGERDSGGN